MFVQSEGTVKRFDALAALELLAEEVPTSHIEALSLSVRRHILDAVELEEAQQAIRLALTVRGQLERLQKRETNLSALVDTARDLAVPSDLEAVLRIIIRRARLLLGGDISYIALRDQPDEPTYVRASDGHVTSLSIGLQVPGTSGMGDVVSSSLSPFWTHDYLADTRFPHDDAIDKMVGAEGLRAIMAVPLSHGSRSFGALYVGDRTVRYFTREDVVLLSSLGDLAGVAIETALTLDQAHSVADSLSEHVTRADRRLQQMHELQDMHDQFMELVLTGADPHMLAAETRARLGGSVRVFHANGTVLTTVGEMGDPDPATDSVAAMKAHANTDAVQVGPRLWSVDIHAGVESLGTLIHLGQATLTDRDRRLLSMAAQAMALMLVQPGKAVPAPCEARNELLGDLLASPQLPPRQLEKRAGRLDIDLSQPHVVVLVHPDRDAGGEAAVWASRYSHRHGGLTSIYNRCVVMLLPGADPGGTARAVWEELNPLLDRPVTISAAGPIIDPASVFHGYHEALRCLDAMTALGVGGSFASARELGFFGLLLSDNHDVDSFLETTIGPLLDYDQTRLTELTPTLDAYFETGGSPTHAARRLHVHANTVSRRLERINEVLGPDWQKPSRVLEIQLALRLARIRGHLRVRRASPSGRDMPAPDAAPPAAPS